MYQAQTASAMNEAPIVGLLSQRAITPHFQAIVDINRNQILGTEALARCDAGQPFSSPDELFAAGKKAGVSLELEQLCVERALERCQALALANSKLFLNVSSTYFEQLLEAGHAFCNRLFDAAIQYEIVLELSEKYPFQNYDKIRRLSQMLREHNIKIAIDDLGAGYSGLRSWAEIQPDYVKVDRHFVDNIHNDSIKREFIRSIQEIARGLNCEVIAEGIELNEELQVLRAMGIKYMQGYHLHRPELAPDLNLIQKQLPDNKGGLSHANVHRRHAQMISSLTLDSHWIGPEIDAAEVCNLFKANARLEALPVVRDNKTLGVVFRHQLLEKFAGRFSYELFGRKSIAKFMNSDYIQCESQETLEAVSNKLTTNSDSMSSVFVVVDSDSTFLGTGKTVDLLRKITDYQLTLARHCNPLTLLPGNMKIGEALNDFIESGIDFYATYLDLNNFKPFNDKYGYKKGDEILKLLGELVSRNIQPGLDFVGHLGGDDFVVFMRSNDWRQRCEKIGQQFANQSQTHYPPEALSENGFWSVDRRGKKDFFPLVGITMGVCAIKSAETVEGSQVADQLTQAKAEAKKLPANTPQLIR